MVVLEALSHGLPVVVSGARWCGIAAELQDGVNALLLDDPMDVARLVTRVREVLVNDHNRLALSQAGISYALQHLWQQVGRCYVDLMSRKG
jgi:UDP-glucose:(heptosyl)LPS alpha-1,3-glucosyltransferase